MITRNHESLYTDLFDMANKFLGLPKQDENGNEIPAINNIDSYFEHLEELVFDGSDPIYAILPQDEELFEIDANKRKINVPASFSGGASVVGDEIAETIYFSIDRYFDITDFYAAHLIPIVQWEITNNGQKEIGYSATTPKTINLVPDKVVFGWPLSSEITKVPGNVTFSVRFYETAKNEDDEDVLVYSFSTQSATIKINNSLTLDLINGGIEETNKLNLMYSRVRNSLPADVNFHAIIPLLDMAPYMAGNDYPAFGGEYNLEDGQLLLVAKSYYPHLTSMSQIGEQVYTWFRKDASGKIEEIGNANEEVFVKTNDVNANSTEKYYILNENLEYVEYDHDKDFDKNNIYEKAFGIIVEKGGNYFVKITNKISNSNFKTLAPEEFIVIPLPKKVSFENNDDKAYHAIIRDGEAVLSLNVTNPDGDTSKLSYQWINEDNIESDVSDNVNYSVSEPGAYRLKVINTKNNDSSAVSVSEPIITTYPASIPQIIGYNWSGMSVNPTDGKFNLSDDGTMRIEVANPEYSDNGLSFQWYVGGVKSKNTTNEFEFTPEHDGKIIYCEITNVYNKIDKTEPVLSADMVLKMK